MTEKDEKRISNQFSSFCTRVLKNETLNIERAYQRQNKRETSIEYISSDELMKISTMDKYFNGIHFFTVLGNKEVAVTGDELANAIQSLPQYKREIILLFYFGGMTDKEIAKHFNVVQQTISKHRHKTLKQLYDYFQKEDLEWDEL